MHHVITRVAILVLLAPFAAADGPLKVFILAGQSNMVGAGEVEAREDKNGGKGSLAHLVKDKATKNRFAHLVDKKGEWIERDDVWISFTGARDVRGRLAPGYGARGTAIGPELGFGHVIGEHLDDDVLLVKVAWGGKSLAVDFRPPSAGGEVGPNYTELFTQVSDVLANLEERFPELRKTVRSAKVDGHDKGYEIVGFGWHQGWNDRINQEFNDAYEENMACFIRDARKELGVPDLPFVIAETGMNGPDETHPRALSLMKAQAGVAKREEFKDTVAFVGTRHFYRPKEESPSGQGYHWNSNAETYYLIGEGMGNAMVALLDARVR